MKLIARRREAQAALERVLQREHLWSLRTHRARAWTSRHRVGVIVGGGLVAGVASSLLPIAAVMRLLSALAGTASLMLEGPFLRLLSAQRARPTENVADRTPT